MYDTVIVIGGGDDGRKKTVLVMVGVAVVAVLLTLALVPVFYHPPSKPCPTNATSPVNATCPPCPTNVTRPCPTNITQPATAPCPNATSPVNVTLPVNVTMTQALYLVIYNPSNQPTASPHDQPITIPCTFLQSLWNESFGYVPSCQTIADNVTFVENNQVLPAYPFISGNLITWWVKMPGIPAKTSVDVSVILGNSSSITSPANVFLIYGSISSLKPGYVYVLNTTGDGVTMIYNQSSISPFIYVVNGSTWLFTPNNNQAGNGLVASYIGSGYLDIAVTPSGQYLVSTTQSPYAPFQSGYQLTSLSSTYSIVYIPQSVLDELSGLGAVYVTSLVNPPPYGNSLVLTSTNPYFIQLPQCSISTNPYGGAVGTYGLLNCLAIEDGGTWAVIRFYYQPGDKGVLLSFQNAQYSSSPSGWTPWVYVGTNGILYVGDWEKVGTNPWQVTFSLVPGWNTLIVGEYYYGGNYYLVAYLDNSSNSKAAVPTPYITQLFGLGGPFQYSDVGTGYAAGAWPSTNGGWFFYTDVIDYIALYGGGASVGTSLASKVFSIASQQESSVPGYAIDYPPNGVEPSVIVIYLKTPSGLTTLLPSQLGIINYEIRIVGS